MLSRLDQRATLYAQTLTPDGGGGFSESWAAFAVVWVALEALAATDAPHAGKMESRIRHRLTLRRRADLAAGQRAVIGPRSFRIHAVLDDGPQLHFVKLNVEELPPGDQQ